MDGIRREKRIGGFFYKPVKENMPIHKPQHKDEVKSTDKASTDTKNQKPAEHYDIEILNEQIGNLKNVYRQFNRDEYELEEHFKHLVEHPSELLKELMELVAAYNQAVLSLHQFDHAFNTSYIMSIASLLMPHQYRLKSIGIWVQDDYQLELKASQFKEELKNDPRILRFLFGNKKGLFVKILGIFHHIKVPSKNLPPNSPEAFEGTIIDKRG